MAFLDEITGALRDSPVMQKAMSFRYGPGADPSYEAALKDYKTQGYPAPGATQDVGEAQRYSSAKAAGKRFGPLPLATNALHEALLSWFSEGEGKPNLKRWKAGNKGVFDALSEPPEASAKLGRFR